MGGAEKKEASADEEFKITTTHLGDYLPMDIQKIHEDKNNNTVTFSLKGTNHAFANALRRAMIENVPTMAIETVKFSKNSSILYDEIVSHRLGLVPLTTDLKGYNLTAGCKCKGEGCARCQATFTLKESGAGIVEATSMKSSDPKVKPVYPIPVVKLLKGQDIEFEATARLGTGKDHAKFSPCHVWYRYMPIIEIDESACTNAEEVAKNCPTKVFKAEKGRLKVADREACILCGACADLGANNSIKLNETDKDFLFFVEPWGQLSVKEIVTTALEVLSQDITAFEEAFKSIA